MRASSCAPRHGAWGWSVPGLAELGLVPEPCGAVGGDGSQGQAVPSGGPGCTPGGVRGCTGPCSPSQGRAACIPPWVPAGGNNPRRALPG